MKNRICNNLPNIVTLLRIIGTAALIFTVFPSPEFIIIYSFCGATDIIDGALARGLHAQSELGSKLDSIADIFFYAVSIAVMMPVLLKTVSLPIWIITIAVVAIRAISYAVAALKFHRFSSLHTWGNKITGALIFTLPYILKFFDRFFPVVAAVVVTVAALSSIEELALHLTLKEYDPERKSIFDSPCEKKSV